MGQTLAVTLQNLRSLPQRLVSSLVAVLGVAGVVAVLVGVLSMARGFEQTLATGGAPDGAVVLRSGSGSELDSGLSEEQGRIIVAAPGVARVGGEPLASPEGFAMIDLIKRSSGTSANAPLRGVGPRAREVRRGFSLVDGRMFEPGRREVIAGQGAASQFEGVALGETLELGDQRWDVVGIFETDGSAAESELWTDLPVFRDEFNRSGYQVVYVRLESADSFALFRDTLMADPRLSPMIERESDYFAEQAAQLTTLIQVIGYGIALLMSLGAVFGALNTMYTAVADRAREIGTLRALGFGRGPIVVSVLVEAVLLALIGGLLGSAIAYVLFNGYAVSTLNFQSFTQIVFAFRVTPELLVQGVGLAVLIGAVGGLAPAVRAARMPITSALRAT